MYLALSNMNPKLFWQDTSTSHKIHTLPIQRMWYVSDTKYQQNLMIILCKMKFVTVNHLLVVYLSFGSSHHGHGSLSCRSHSPDVCGVCSCWDAYGLHKLHKVSCNRISHGRPKPRLPEPDRSTVSSSWWVVWAGGRIC